VASPYTGDVRGAGRPPPSKVDKIRRHIVIHMGPNPLYDDLSAFFASYAELSALYDEEATSYYGGSSSSPSSVPPLMCHAPTVIAALVTHDHPPPLMTWSS
jgi:hypothetical protein